MKQKLYIVLFNLVALAALSYIGVDIFYRALSLQFSDIRASQMSEVTIQKRVHQERPQLKHFDVIVDRNIFGAAETAAGVAETPEIQKEDIEALEPTSLKIALLGTVTGPEESARAVIEDSGRKTQGLYRVGDAVQDAVIRKIVRGKVVLRVGEKDEVLSMDTPEASAGGHALAGPTGRGDTVTLARSDIHQSLQNINQLLTEARIRPYLKDGKPDGFILSYIKANSFFTQLGLQRGDIVKSINSKPINTPEDAFSFYKAIESGQPLSMEILRAGQPRTINYQFK
jgi:general secretion pathway protein C